MIHIEGDDLVAAALEGAARMVDTKLTSTLMPVVAAIEMGYRSSVSRRSGRTAAGVQSEVRRTVGGVEGEVWNDHFAAGFHEFGGARSGPNPALKFATDRAVPGWWSKVEDVAGDV